jgi:hypothetical protein
VLYVLYLIGVKDDDLRRFTRDMLCWIRVRNSASGNHQQSCHDVRMHPSDKKAVKHNEKSHGRPYVKSRKPSPRVPLLGLTCSRHHTPTNGTNPESCSALRVKIARFMLVDEVELTTGGVSARSSKPICTD